MPTQDLSVLFLGTERTLRGCYNAGEWNVFKN